MLLGIIVFFVLLKVTAPYGRHTSTSWGPQIDNSLGWVLMEVPVMLALMYFVIGSTSIYNAFTITLVAMFMFHYINRTFIFPFRIKSKGKKMPLVIVGSAIIFNSINGFFLGYYFANVANYSNNDFMTPRFVIGISLFAIGMFINWRYDNKLIQLRSGDNKGYVIPQGGLFNYISCPNLFGEIVEWTGFAIICWSLPAASFLVWTLANLVPRAIAHHRWYKQKFADYPEKRKGIIPFIV